MQNEKPENLPLVSFQPLDASTAFSLELQRFAHAPSLPEHPLQSNPARPADQQPLPSNSATEQLPRLTVEQQAPPTNNLKPEEHSIFGNSVLNTSIGMTALVASEAILGAIFRSPKLLGVAIETLEGTTQLTKAAYGARILATSGALGGTFGTGIVARHYAHEAITGDHESWLKSTEEFGIGLGTSYLGQKLTTKFIGKPPL